MKIVVMTDVHANLPALKAAFNAIKAGGYDVIFHTGDAIAIGPHPAECLDFLIHIPKIQFVRGNHETYFINGLSTPQPACMSDGEVQHYHWTHSHLDSQLKHVLAKWPYVLEHEFQGVKTTFVHYALAPSGRDFMPLVNPLTAVNLDRSFGGHDSELIFYGHDHRKSDVAGEARYVNPGSLGCYSKAVARYCVVEFHQGKYKVKHHSVPYDDAELFKAFERRMVPDREFIYREFFGGRF